MSAANKPVEDLSDEQRHPIKRALISVYDKTGLLELAATLTAAGVEIVSTGSTAAQIADAGFSVTPVDELTGFPECLEGRVKTLHPKIHAGILADTRKPDHVAQIADLGIEAFDLVVVNLYPFRETVASGAEFAGCVEQIDIGGPSMVRAAAKNHPSVAVVVDPVDYPSVVDAIGAGGFEYRERKNLAKKAFQHTASYDIAVASWFTEQLSDDEVLPEWYARDFTLKNSLRYGENSHQRAGIYLSGGEAANSGIVNAEQLGGKEMSFNNFVDADAAWRAALDHDGATVAVIKHSNPCGIATAPTIEQAHARAHACDPVSAYGGVIAANREVTLKLAEQVKPIFTEVIIAPSFEPAALELLQSKKNLRILAMGELPASRESLEFREVTGGLLLQDKDLIDATGDGVSQWQLVAGPAADAETLADLEFAWRACRAIKSNAILLAKGGATVGVGMGQVNRLDSCHLAVDRANTLAGEEQRAVGSVAASDAFFPFADGLEILIKAGIKAVVHPAGSIRDEEVFAAAEKAGVTMYTTGVRHFYH